MKTGVRIVKSARGIQMYKKIISITVLSFVCSAFALQPPRPENHGTGVSIDLDEIGMSSFSVRGEPAQALFNRLAINLPVIEDSDFTYVKGTGITCFKRDAAHSCDFIVLHSDGSVVPDDVADGAPRIGAGN